jgi:nucleoside diphosphate kinase
VLQRAPVVAQAPSAVYTATLERRLADLEIDKANRTHSAFVFIKPHAVYDKVKDLVREHLEKNNIFVVSEGSIAAEEIDSKQLIDTHYGAIAEKAVKLKPAQMTVQQKAQDEFQKQFGASWQDVLAQGLVFNAMDAAAKLGISTQELGAKWGKCQKGVGLLKFGGGFYVGKIDSIYVINGFYMDMRGKFTTPGTSIYYFETEWDPRSLKWEDFRGKVLGGTDPKTAAKGSARNMIYNDWKKLGLQACPDTGDNGVHASASPFEALAERANWLNVPIGDDFYGRAMLASGIPGPMIQEWTSDPGVNFEGKKQSLFDLLEDLDSRECLKKSKLIAAANR